MSESRDPAEVRRRASRLIVLDGDGRALLFQYAHPTGERYWATPGGGLEGDETFEAAAAREAAEELGIMALSLRALWEATAILRSGVIQEERYFLVQGAEIHFGRSVLGRQQEGVLEERWWSLHEIEATDDEVFPDHLAARLRDALARHSLGRQDTATRVFTDVSAVLGQE